jgi:hypothetical protein
MNEWIPVESVSQLTAIDEMVFDGGGRTGLR